MMEVLQGEFFWGIIVGLLLSFVAGWALAHFTVALNHKHAKKMIVRFCIDTIKNIQNIISEMDTTRDRANAIHPDFLELISVEIAVYGRNREHLIQLPDAERNEVRRFMNDVAVKRAQIVQKLDQFHKLHILADQLQASGDGPQAQRKRAESMTSLQDAQAAADKLATVANNGRPLVDRLAGLQ